MNLATFRSVWLILASAMLLTEHALAQTGDSFTTDAAGNLTSESPSSSSAPTIVTQPIGGTVAVGSNFTFTVTVSGAGPISYQWYAGTNMLGGQTGDTLVLTNLQQANTALYSVHVTNNGGTTPSAGAQLTVAPTLFALEHIAFGDGIYVAVGDQGALITSTDGVTWSKVAIGTTEPFYCVIFADNMFVAVGKAGTVFTSSDGVHWTSQYAGTFSDLYSVIYAGGEFMAVGYLGVVITSPDAVNWTLQTAGLGALATSVYNLYSVTYGNGDYVAVGDAGSIAISPDGIHWTLETPPVNVALRAITFGNGVFVAVGDGGTILESTNGTTWNTENSATTAGLTGIEYLGGVFYVLGPAGELLVSSNGTAWAANFFNATEDFNDVTLFGSGLLTVGTGGAIATPEIPPTVALMEPGSTMTVALETQLTLTAAAQGGTGGVDHVEFWVNGALYQSATGPFTAPFTASSYLDYSVYAVAVDANGNRSQTPAQTISVSLPLTPRCPGSTGGNLASAAYGNDVYVIVATDGTLLRSADGIVFQPMAVASAALDSVAFGNGIFVATGNSGLILSSPDGNTWTAQTSSTTDGLRSIAFGDGQFVAVGDNGTILTSTAGTAWAAQSSADGTADLHSVAYGGQPGAQIFAASGDYGVFETSANGSAWTNHGIGGYSSGYGLAYGAGRFVSVGSSGLIYTSTDGTSWSPASSGTASYLLGVAFGNGRFVAGGYSDELFESTDGLSWTPVITSGSSFNNVSFANDRFYGLEDSGEVLISFDGLEWSEPAKPTAQALNGLATDGNRFVAVGDNGAIVTSGDGIFWSLADVPGADSLSAIAYGAGTFVALSNNSSAYVSPDGLHWSIRPIGSFAYLSDITFGSGQFVAVGDGIYTSPDGVSWTAQTVNGQDFISLDSICSNAGLYVAAGYSGMIVTSPDGVNWTVQTSGTTNTLIGVCYANEIFLATESNGAAISSTDGVHWNDTQSLLSADDEFVYLYHLSAARNTFFASDGYSIYTTNDGHTWRTNTFSHAGGAYGAAEAHGTLVVSGTAGTIYQAGEPDELYPLAALSQPSGNLTVSLGSTAPISAFATAPAGSVQKVEFYVDGSKIGEADNAPYSAPPFTADSYGDYEVRAVVTDNQNLVTESQPVTISVPFPASVGQRDPRFTSAELQGATYGNGLWMVVGGEDSSVNGALFVSHDTIHWTAPATFPEVEFTGVAFGRGEFVAGANSGAIYTSADGAHWRNTYTNSYGVTSVTWTGGRFLATAYDSIVTSPDGNVWSRQAIGNYSLNQAAYGAGIYVAVGYDGADLTSTDGVQWTAHSGLSDSLMSIAFGDGVFVAVSSEGNIFTSTNGAAWTQRSTGVAGGEGSLYAIAFGKGFMAAGYEVGTVSGGGTVEYALTSSNGITWKKHVLPGFPSFQAVHYAAGKWLLAGEDGAILTTTNDSTYVNPVHLTNQGFLAAAYGGGKVVAVGDTGLIASSTDGQNWKNQKSGTKSNLNAIVFGENQFVVVGDAGEILTSANATAWTSRKSGTTSYLEGLAFGSSLFVAVGSSGEICTSPDGVTWTTRTSGISDSLEAVAFGNGLFVAVGIEGDILTSPDGKTWTAQTSGTTSEITSIAFGSGRFVAVSNSTALVSTDGVTWQPEPLPADGSTITFANNSFIVFDYSEMYVSADGIGWESISLPDDAGAAVAAFNQLLAFGYEGNIFATPQLTQSSTLLTINISGDGSVSPGFSGTTKRIGGRSYTVTATAAVGYYFTGWSGGLGSTDAQLKFDMPSGGLILTAQFAPLPSVAAAGSYSGLAIPTAASVAGTGFLSATLSPSGAVTGKLILAGEKYTIRGAFNIAGTASGSITRRKQSSLNYSLQIDSANARLTGIVTDGSLNGITVTGGTFSSDIDAYASVYNASSYPCPVTGKYTILLPPPQNSATVPNGYGYGVVQVSRSGAVKLTGALGDGSVISQGTNLSPANVWPCYAALYGNGGYIYGSMTFAKVQDVSDFAGALTWQKPAISGAALYPSGFNNLQVSAIGSLYTRPKAGTRVLDFANSTGNAMISFGQAGLASPPPSITATLANSNAVTSQTSSFSMKIKTSAGLFSGSFPDPTTKKPHTFNGVIFQDQNYGGGLFIGTGQTGELLFQH